ncbi:MAG: hypothetical protein ABIH27_01775 [Candidatus Omnitrophota bacterium]
MEENANNKKSCKVKTFFKGLVEKMDKKMQEKAKNGGSCCNNGKTGDKPCCS